MSMNEYWVNLPQHLIHFTTSLGHEFKATFSSLIKHLHSADPCSLQERVGKPFKELKKKGL